MLNATTFPFASTAAETVVSMARRNVEVFDQFTASVKGTPVAPLFEIASKFHHTALEGFEAMTGAVEASAAKPAAKSKTAKTDKAAAAAKKIIDSQADALAEAGARTVAASADTAKAVTKAAESGDMVKLYDDLTAINGVGPATMRKLQDAGIRSIEDVANMSAKALGDILDDAGIRMLKFTPKDWIADAKKLVKKAA